MPLMSLQPMSRVLSINDVNFATYGIFAGDELGLGSFRFGTQGHDEGQKIGEYRKVWGS